MLNLVKSVNIVRAHAEFNQCIRTMKYLNVAEKNDAAKTISGFLSKGTAKRREGLSVYNKIYDFDSTVKGVKCNMTMTSVSGHLMQLEFLPSYRIWRNVNPQSLFDAPIQKSCNENFLKIKKTLEREIKSCQGLIIWTDCDREGENIGFEIINVCRAIKPQIAVHRAIFSEITAVSVRRALENLKVPDKLQSDAVDVRTELDLRTGAAITRYQTMRFQRLFPEKIAEKLISYGSCQIPTLGFVAERYKEVEDFVSEPFWKIKVTHVKDDFAVEFNWDRNRLFNKEECEDYLMLCLADPIAKVEMVTVKPKSKWRPTPLDTVEMEKLGSRKLKLSAKETMTIAEKLYTKGIISYPRTETNIFSKEFDLRSLVDQQRGHSVWGSFAERVMEWSPNPRNGNKSDQAHPPIHPTKLVTNLDGNEARVYELICRHFLACVSKDAMGSETVVKINIAGEKFTAKGLYIHERNYLDVYTYENWNAKQIHKYEDGDTFEPTEISMPEGATTAPPLLTEADLIALMEKHGIGTDATHAEHINTIKERGYIGVADKGCLVPGVIGMGLYEGYNAMELVLAKPVLRAQFEADLKEICVGRKEPKEVLREQIVKYKEAFQKIMEKITAMDEKLALRINETPSTDTNPQNVAENTLKAQELFKCPKCNRASLSLKQKKNQNSFFIGCMNFPDCKNVIWLPDEIKEPTVLDETCEKCGAEVNLLKFNFSTIFHKSMFNAFGSYKTCLRCDTKFHNAFNIDLESVKLVGSIVGTDNTSTIQQNVNTCIQNSNNAFGGRSANAVEQMARKSKKVKKKPSSIENFFTSVNRTEPHAEDFVQSSDMQLENFFENDDGFEELMLAADEYMFETPTSISSTVVSGIEQSNELAARATDGNGVQHYHNVASTESTTNLANESLSEFFEDEEEFENYSWGSVGLNRDDTRNISQPSKRARISSGIENFPEPYRNLQPTENIPEEEHPKCLGCHQPAKKLNVKKEGPNNGRVFYICPKVANPCKYFQWADEIVNTNSSMNESQNHLGSSNSMFATHSNFNSPVDMMTTDPNDVIKCRCNEPAKSLIVRKEGPNQGRKFLTCAKSSNSCGFFKWNDDDNQASTSTGVRHGDQAWGSTRSALHSIPPAENSDKKNSQNSNDGSRTKKRRCGLCRQEGHTKLKCPRKAEFEV